MVEDLVLTSMMYPFCVTAFLFGVSVLDVPFKVTRCFYLDFAKVSLSTDDIIRPNSPSFLQF